MTNTTEALDEVSTPNFGFTQYLTDTDVVCINYRGMTIIKPVSEIVKSLESQESTTEKSSLVQEQLSGNTGQVEQKPVAKIVKQPFHDDKADIKSVPMVQWLNGIIPPIDTLLYTHPAQPLTRDWLGTVLGRADKDEAYRKALIGELAEPLSDDEIYKMRDKHTSVLFGNNHLNVSEFARAIEQAHGIGVKDGV